MAFCTLINYFRKLFEFFRCYFRHVLAETTTGRCSLKRFDPKSLIKKGEEWQIDNKKNIEKLLWSRLLDFLLFHIKGNHKNLSEILVKQLFLIDFRCTIVIKANYLTITFQRICRPFRNSYFKEQLLCAYRAEPYP